MKKKLTELKGERQQTKTKTDGDFCASLSVTERTREETNKKTGLKYYKLIRFNR